MSSNSDFSSDPTLNSTQITPSAGTRNTPTAGGVQAPRFRTFLRRHSIFINDTDASTELVKRAKEIITNKYSGLEMDDALAEELALEAWNLETGTEPGLVRQLVTPLIPAITKAPHQSLEKSEDKLWSNAVTVPLHPKVVAILPPLPKPQPGSVFGYSEKAFNETQLMALDTLVQLNQDYAMPDGKVETLMGLKAVDLAVKSILHYGANERLKKICEEIDIYSQKVKEKAIIDKGHLASDSLPEEQQQQRPGDKRRPRRARQNIADDEDEEAEEGR